MTTAATAKALDANEGQQVIVVVLLPNGPGRSDLGDHRGAQIYRLPSCRAEGLGESSRAIQAAVAQGFATSPLPVEILARLARALKQPTSEPYEAPRRPAIAPVAAPTPFPSLTPRESQVLQLVLEGLQNKNIANVLSISMRTVENHRAAIMRKTGSKSLPALVRLAIAAGAGGGLAPVARPIGALAPRVRQAPSELHDAMIA